MITLLDYGGGNLTSVARSLAAIGYSSQITRDRHVLEQADIILFPGVGAAGQAMEALRKLDLLSPLLDAINAGKPFIGICVGCQLLLEYSEENDTSCLGIFSGTVKKFPPHHEYKVPHMGWNTVKFSPETNYSQQNREDFFYFVHSYYPDLDHDYALGTTSYGVTFPSIFRKEQVVGIQFHIEKSGQQGLTLLQKLLTEMLP